MTLTKDAIISAVAQANGYPRNQAIELIETLLELIKSKLAAPATGNSMMLKARRVVTFKCSWQLKDKINNPHQ